MPAGQGEQRGGGRACSLEVWQCLEYLVRMVSTWGQLPAGLPRATVSLCRIVPGLGEAVSGTDENGKGALGDGGNTVLGTEELKIQPFIFSFV